MWYHFRANFYLQTSILSEWSKLRSNIIVRKIPSKKEVAPPYNIHCFRTTGVLRRSPFLIWLRIMFSKRACYEFSVVIDAVNSLFFFGLESDHWLPLSVTHSLTNSLTDSCLVDLMAFYDANCLMMSQQLLYCGKLFFKVGKRLCELSTYGWGCQTLDSYAIWSCWGNLPNQKFSWINMINLPIHVTKCGKSYLADIANCIWYLSRYSSSPVSVH